MKNQRRVHPGFTLIEAIIAIVILGVAVPPMLWSIQDSQVSRVAPILVSRARWLATEKLEDIVADRHSSTRGYGYVVDASYPAEAAVTGMTGFSRSVSITETGAAMASGGTGYKLVTVTVGWIDARAQARSLSLSTVVTDY